MEDITELGQLEAPYGKQITLNKVTYDNGFSLIRMRIKEGKRFTDMDLDINTVKSLSGIFSQWADAESKMHESD